MAIVRCKLLLPAQKLQTDIGHSEFANDRTIVSWPMHAYAKQPLVMTCSKDLQRIGFVGI